jgi:hypothetical protein
VPELAHAGIDDGVTGLTTLPGAQFFAVRILGPGEAFKILAQGPRGSLRKMKQQVVAKV